MEVIHLKDWKVDWRSLVLARAEEVPLSYHNYESKLEGKAILSISYSVADDGDIQESEALWYYNPAEKRVKALDVTYLMDFSVFECAEINFDGEP